MLVVLLVVELASWRERGRGSLNSDQGERRESKDG